MSADGAGAIGPVSVRYAAQIRELLHAQALQRMAAAAEAARASDAAERAARVEPVEQPKPAPEPVKPRSDIAASARQIEVQPEASGQAEPSAAGHLVDIEA